MENPVINTWEGGDRLVDLSNRLIDQRFPGHDFKALMGWEGNRNLGSRGGPGGYARCLREASGSRIVRPMHSLPFGHGADCGHHGCRMRRSRL